MMILDPVFLQDPTSLADWLYDHICDRMPKRRWVPCDPFCRLFLFIIISLPAYRKPSAAAYAAAAALRMVDIPFILHVDHVNLLVLLFITYSLSPLPTFLLLLLCFSIHYTFDLHNRVSLIASQYTNSFHCIPISMLIIIITTALCAQVLSSTPLTNALLS